MAFVHQNAGTTLFAGFATVRENRRLPIPAGRPTRAADSNAAIAYQTRNGHIVNVTTTYKGGPLNTSRTCCNPLCGTRQSMEWRRGGPNREWMCSKCGCYWYHHKAYRKPRANEHIVKAKKARVAAGAATTAGANNGNPR